MLRNATRQSVKMFRLNSFVCKFICGSAMRPIDSLPKLKLYWKSLSRLMVCENELTMRLVYLRLHLFAHLHSGTWNKSWLRLLASVLYRPVKKHLKSGSRVKWACRRTRPDWAPARVRNRVRVRKRVKYDNSLSGFLGRLKKPKEASRRPSLATVNNNANGSLFCSAANATRRRRPPLSVNVAHC